MLGMRREGVTEAASELKRRGLITYARGQIRIIDSQALASAACCCYEIVNKVFRRAQLRLK
jgi:hypothetical protein